MMAFYSKYGRKINWAKVYDTNLDVSVIGSLSNLIAIPYSTPISHLYWIGLKI